MLFREGLIQQIPYLIAAFLPALTFHEWGHAMMAKLHGDDTAEREGRLSLNPLAHLDPFGTLAILIIGFGWAKPVPVNPAQMKGKWAELLVASAGPLMNIILAAFFGILYQIGFAYWFGLENAGIIVKIIQISIILNLALCFFNLIPIGPLDGRTVLTRLLPLRQSMGFEMWNARYGSFVLLALILSEFILPIGLLRLIVGIPTMFFSQVLMMG